MGSVFLSTASYGDDDGRYRVSIAAFPPVAVLIDGILTGRHTVFATFVSVDKPSPLPSGRNSARDFVERIRGEKGLAQEDVLLSSIQKKGDTDVSFLTCWYTSKDQRTTLRSKIALLKTFRIHAIVMDSVSH